MFENTYHIPEILILLYIIITFGYSAVEKAMNWEDSKVYYKNHFKGTVLEKTISFFLLLVIVIELIVVFTGIVGVFSLVVFNEMGIAFLSIIIASLTLIGLMIGQRIAKDYNGAMLITVYFILTVFGLLLLT